MTYTDAVRNALADILRDDPRAVVVGEDVAHHGGMFRATQGLLDEFGPRRVWDTPISEAAFTGMALGAAMAGLRPVVELMFFDFSLVAMDQLFNQIAKTRYMSGGKVDVPLVVRTQGGGYKGAAAQHSQMLESLFLHTPGWKVVAPARPEDAHLLLKAAAKEQDPVLFVEHKQLYGVSGDAAEGVTQLGMARPVRSGDVTVLSWSYMTHLVGQVEEFIDHIDLVSLNPLDWDAIANSVRRTHRVLIVQEAVGRASFGAWLAAEIQARYFDELDAPVQLLAAKDVPLPFAKELEAAALPSTHSIQAAIQELRR
jgi:pyruvate dehydrogenase E1 component beta subunit